MSALWSCLRWRPHVEGDRWVFEGRRFFKCRDRGGRIFTKTDFRRCTFDNCSLLSITDHRRRAVIRDVQLHNCICFASHVKGAPIVEDVLIDGLETRSKLLLICWGAVFRRVVLRGRIGFFRVTSEPWTSRPSSAKAKSVRAAFLDANARFYRTADRAIDIRDAEFYERAPDLIGIPGHLIRRDPATQALVRRERVLQHSWQELRTPTSGWMCTISDLLRGATDSVVLAAPKGSPKFGRYMKELEMLRDAGIAEPD